MLLFAHTFDQLSTRLHSFHRFALCHGKQYSDKSTSSISDIIALNGIFRMFVTLNPEESLWLSDQSSGVEDVSG